MWLRPEYAQKYVGREISNIKLVENTYVSGYYFEVDTLEIKFADGTTIIIYDGGQLCCEHRYMRTDDDLAYFVGSKFLGYELKEVPYDYESESEIEFLEIQTTLGVFTMVNHNSHNGYYGGFALRIHEKGEDDDE